MDGNILAIDFGTSYSCAAVVTPEHGVRTVETHGLRESTPMWPSAVFADGPRLLAGHRAIAELANGKDSDGYRDEFKRELGEPAPIVLGRQQFMPVQLVQAVLAELSAAAVSFTHKPISRAVLTVPASYSEGGRRRTLMIKAAENLGLNPVELLPEPVAAAFAPEFPEFEPGELILVYDFGGGTFDAALIRIGAAGGEVLKCAWLDKCGGIDLDRKLIGRLQADPAIRDWRDAKLGIVPESERAKQEIRLREDVGMLARKLKHDLTSRKTEARGRVTPTAPESRLLREVLEVEAAPLLQETIECCRGLVSQLKGLAMQDVSGVLLVGGSTRMPIVAQTVLRDLKRPVFKVHDPDLVVVRGAAEWARKHPITSIRSLPPKAGAALLRWQQEPAFLMRWHVSADQYYQMGEPLARVRFHDGTVWDFVAEKAGCLDQVLSEPGQTLKPGEWIAVTTTRSVTKV